MNRRNFILLIIVLGIVSVVTLGFLYGRGPANPTGTDNGAGTNFFSNFNPFRRNSTPSGENSNGGEGTTEPGPGATTTPPTPKLLRVSALPVAGYVAYKKERLKEIPPIVPVSSISDSTAAPATPPKPKTKPTPPATEFATALRYVSRVTGEVYQTFADKINEIKFSSTTVPRVYEAYFGNSATAVIMRYLKGTQIIQTFTGNLPKEVLGGDSTLPNEIKGSFLPENITDLSLSPDALKIFYLLKTGDGVSGTTYGLVDGKKLQIFSSPFTEWLSYWPSPGTITLTTKPSGRVSGYMYKVDTGTKSVSRVLGPVSGLTTLTSPSGKLVLYSDSGLNLNIYHTDTKTTSAVGVRTMPEKCVWGGDSTYLYCAVPKLIGVGEYPDTWYQGEVSFSDSIWKVDVALGTTTIVADPTTIEGGEAVDGIKLSLDSSLGYLFFVDKKNSNLWELSLK